MPKHAQQQPIRMPIRMPLTDLRLFHGWTADEVMIEIVSGEGDVGSHEVYQGIGSVRALRARLTRERCRGDRWAHFQARYPNGCAEPIDVDLAAQVIAAKAVQP